MRGLLDFFFLFFGPDYSFLLPTKATLSQRSPDHPTGSAVCEDDLFLWLALLGFGLVFGRLTTY